MPERCTDPCCEQHWPTTGTIYVSLHTANHPPPTESPIYPRRDITWTKGEATVIESWSAFAIGAGEDDDDDDDE